METILHITTQSRWAARSADAFEPASLRTEGFIHCCTRRQVQHVVSHFFQNELERRPSELIALVIDPVQLTSPLRWEDTGPRHPGPFPHIYGPLNVHAVSQVLTISQADDDHFELVSDTGPV